MQGLTSRVVPCRRRPRISSSPMRYIQPAEPVYQRPAPAPDAIGVRGDVGRHHVGLDLVALGLGARPRVVDGIEHVEELDGFVAASEPGEGHDHPERGVGVLTAVLADAGRVGRRCSRGPGGERRRGGRGAG